MFKIWDNYAGWKVLEFFLKNPTKTFYLRQAAKEIGVSNLTASTYLEAYAKEGILNREKRAHMLEFSLNESNLLPNLLKKSYALYIARENSVVEKILKAAPYAMTICIYGSYANGEIR